jgi:hypothetical protein
MQGEWDPHLQLQEPLRPLGLAPDPPEQECLESLGWGRPGWGRQVIAGFDAGWAVEEQEAMGVAL